MKTYNDIYLDNKNILRNSGNENYQLEAKLILAAAANKDVSQILANKNLYVNNEVELLNSTYLNRLLNDEPIAYILKNWEFYGLPFYVDTNVLIPRIDTEILIDTTKEIFSNYKSKLRILDLCTGSGCIACALANIYKNSNVTAVDISLEALDVCKKNINNLGLNSQITCLQLDVTNKPNLKLGEYDLIISNPPYIETKEIKTLDNSVKKYEPLIALDGGIDGLLFYRAIIDNYSILLKENSYILFEVGETQSNQVSKLLIDAGFKSSEARKDTLGFNRVVIGKK